MPKIHCDLCNNDYKDLKGLSRHLTHTHQTKLIDYLADRLNTLNPSITSTQYFQAHFIIKTIKKKPAPLPAPEPKTHIYGVKIEDVERLQKQSNDNLALFLKDELRYIHKHKRAPPNASLRQLRKLNRAGYILRRGSHITLCEKTIKLLKL